MAYKSMFSGSATTAALRGCAMAGLLLASACDNGSSPSPTPAPTPTPTPAAPNRAPAFTSTNGMLLAEGQSGTIYRAVAPDYRFGTGPTQGQSIVAGIVYTGPFTPLNGQYIFGDTVTGSIWSVPYASLQQGTTLDATSFTLRNALLVPLTNTINHPIVFDFIPFSSNLYILDQDGELFWMHQR